MSLAHQMAEDYFRSTGQRHDGDLDAAFQYQRTMLRETLSRLEEILRDEQLPEASIRRVIRCMLYGSPSEADAELRMEMAHDMEKLLAEGPPSVILSADAARAAGLLPKDGS